MAHAGNQQTSVYTVYSINIFSSSALVNMQIFSTLTVSQTEQLEQVDTFPYLGSLITEDGECTTEFRTRLNRGQAIGASLQKI